MAFDPKTIAGLNVWLDAAQLALADGAAVSPWPDKSGGGRDGTIVGTPAPVFRKNKLNGQPVVRFRANEGRVRGLSGLAAGTPGKNFTIIVVSRMLGPVLGRIFSGDASDGLMAVGHHSAGPDIVLEYGTGIAGAARWIPAQPTGYVDLPTPWKMHVYAAASNGSNYTGNYYLNKVANGTFTDTRCTGLQTHYNLSGYDATATTETCDCEVAELLIYNRQLTTPERQSVENYLWDKWGLAVPQTLKPTEMIGLNVWLDATQLPYSTSSGPVSPWPDVSGNTRNAVVGGTPAPQYVPGTFAVGGPLDNKPVVRFALSQGYMTGPTGLAAGAAGKNFSVLHVSRVRGPAVSGRIFAASYPTNMLVGSHTTGYDACYEDGYGWIAYTAWGANTSSQWRTHAYLASFDGTNYSSNYYVDQVLKGVDTGAASVGLQTGYSLNTWNPSSETGDVDVAELLIFNRPLLPAERKTVNEYLAAKWLNRVPMDAKSAFDNTAGSLDGGTGWVKAGVTVSPNFAFAPDGTQTADAIDVAAVSGAHLVQWNYPHTDSTPITFSAYLRDNHIPWVRIYFHDNDQWASFDLAAGVIIGTSSANVVARMEKAPNNFFRCSATVTKTGTVNPNISIVSTLSDGTMFWTGDGSGGGFFAWGAELVRSSQPSPIPYVYTGFTAQGESLFGGATRYVVIITGGLTATLGALTAASAAGVSVGGTLTAALADTTFTGTAKAVNYGTVTATLDALVCVGAATAKNVGRITSTLDNVTAVGTGWIAANGTAANTLGLLTLAATGGVESFAALDQTLGPVTLDAFAAPPGSIRLLVRLDDVTLSGTVKNPTVARFTQFLADVTSTGTVITAVSGGLTATLDPLFGAGLGNQYEHGTLNQTLDSVQLTSYAFSYVPSVGIRYGAMFGDLDPVTSAGTGSISLSGGLNRTLDSVLITDTISVGVGARSLLSLDPATLQGIGVSVGGCKVDATLDDVTCTSAMVTNDYARTNVTLEDVALAGDVDAIVIARATPTLSDLYLAPATHAHAVMDGKLLQRLDDATLDSTASAFFPLRLNRTLASLRLTGRGEISLNPHVDVVLDDVVLESSVICVTFAQLSSTLDDLTGDLQAAAVAACVLDQTLGEVKLGAVADLRVAGTVEQTLGGLVLVADAGVVITGTHTTQLDDVALAAIAGADVTATLIETFPPLSVEAYGLHVKRTPILHAYVFVNYVIAHVRVEAVYAVVKADVIVAHTVVENEDDRKVA